MLIHTYKRVSIILCLIIIFILVFFFLSVKTAIVFYKENTTELAAYLPMKQGDSFQFIFKHSIHLTDVVEKYEINADLQIKQYEIVFEEFGIGMPSYAKAEEVFEYNDGKYHIKQLNNLFEVIKIRNGKTVSENRLVWKDNQHEVYFNDYFDPGAWFTVKVEKLTLWNMVKGVKIHE